MSPPRFAQILQVNQEHTDLLLRSDNYWNANTLTPRQSYQTRHIFSRTIAWPLWHPNACANSGMLETTLSTRKRSKGWGLLMTSVRIISGRTLLHQTPA